MKRFSLVVFVLLLVAVPLASAETLPFQLSGEWYTGTVFSNMVYPMERDGDMLVADGVKIEVVKETDTEYFRITDEYGAEAEPIVIPRIAMNESSDLGYMWIDDTWSDSQKLVFMVVEPTENPSVCNYFEAECSGQILFMDGKAISKNEEIFEYMVDGDTLYIVSGNDYLSGQIIPYCEGAFLYKTDEEISAGADIPSVESWILFVRASLVE